MGISRLVTITLIALFALGCDLGISRPANWIFGEFLLLAGALAIVREVHVYEQGAEALRRASVPGASAQSLLHRERREPPRTAPAEQSVEDIAEEMLAQAFRQASMKYHPDHGGNAETMRRVYEARQMLKRALRRKAA